MKQVKDLALSPQRLQSLAGECPHATGVIKKKKKKKKMHTEAKTHKPQLVSQWTIRNTMF